MSQDDPATRQYLNALKAQLQGVPKASRQTILDDVRAHIVDAVEEGREIREILTALGSPEEVARDAREQLGADSAPTTLDSADKAARTLHFASLALAIITAILVSFILPSFAIEEVGMSSEGTGSTIQTATSLFDQFGIGIALLPLFPALLAFLPLVFIPKFRGAVALANAVVMTVISVFAGFSIGGFYVPLTLLMWAAVLVPRWIRRGKSAVAGRSWRIVGGVLIVLPPTLAIIGAITGTFMDPALPFWILATLVVLLGILFALRVKFIDLLVATLGVALMALAIFDAGILVLAVWWGGGLWLVTGLSSFVANRVAPGNGRAQPDKPHPSHPRLLPS
ncbi:MAG: DUF1700 domain-containing protein [Gulosibacter sp.]|uniref:DUF1700 domain-containing protein n=1 Tax=Gulosibacter sp. TaxID=2817531 RepID=UPI003F92D84B